MMGRNIQGSAGISGDSAYCTSRTGYFSATEIVTVLNYLEGVDNPLQDISGLWEAFCLLNRRMHFTGTGRA